jgi:CheY-like chemotaxis protein
MASPRSTLRPQGSQKIVSRATPADRPSSARVCVLLVDVDRNLRRSLAIGLKLLGHRTEEAGDAARALELVHRHHFDLAVIDLLLPDMSGLDLARSLQRIAPDVRLVLTTAYELPSERPEHAGSDGTVWLRKPLRTEDLLHLFPQPAPR